MPAITTASPMLSLLPEKFRAYPAPIVNLMQRLSGLEAVACAYNRIDPSLTGGDFAARALEELKIQVETEVRDLSRIPSQGPVIIVSNHPFGMADGLALASILPRTGRAFRFLANELLYSLPPLRELIIPVDVLSDQTSRNTSGLRHALRWLKDGGMLVVFPSGEVSSWQWKQGAVADPEWNESVSRLAALTGAAVVPACFPGSNSLPFQLLGLVHPGLRTMRLPAELQQKSGSTIQLMFGQPVAARQLVEVGDSAQQTRMLRTRSEVLRFRGGNRDNGVPSSTVAGAVADRQNPEIVHELVPFLTQKRHLMATLGRFSVLKVRASEAPAALQEVGRLREAAFRQAGEGTGREVDLDTFDASYDHLLLWDSEKLRIAGGYRLRTVDRAILRDPSQLYTAASTFRFGRKFLEQLGPGAMELGRSFLSAEYQRDFSALLLLWRGIRQVAEIEGIESLFGAVSISASYQPFSRALMAHWLRQHAWRKDLEALVRPVHRLPVPLTWRRTLASTVENLADFELLSSAIRDVEPDAKGLPVLLRQYMKTGGKVACVGLDPAFGNCLDALVVTQVSQIPKQTMRRLLGG
jgi:putative hemolysin